MKEFIIQNMELIISLVSMIITWLLGKITKRYTKLSNKLIPLQNAIIMIICVVIYYFATGNVSTVIAAGSPVATLIYDVLHNIRQYNLESLEDGETQTTFNTDNLEGDEDEI